MKLTKWLVVLSITLAACSDDSANSSPDSAIPDGPGSPPPMPESGTPIGDSGDTDASTFPAPPTPGAQIDRVGRPLISIALVAMLAPSGASKTAQKDAYNHAVDPATWKTTTLLTNTSIEQEFEQNLAVFDVLDKGLAAVAGSGCGNALSYAGPPSSASYRIAADMLADDQLYIDTSKSQCDVYLALEIESTDPSTGLHTMCGGRTLTQDAIDVTYSVLAAGLSGLAGAPGFGPKIHDGWERMPTLE